MLGMVMLWDKFVVGVSVGEDNMVVGYSIVVLWVGEYGIVVGVFVGFGRFVGFVVWVFGYGKIGGFVVVFVMVAVVVGFGHPKMMNLAGAGRPSRKGQTHTKL